MNLGPPTSGAPVGFYTGSVKEVGYRQAAAQVLVRDQVLNVQRHW